MKTKTSRNWGQYNRKLKRQASLTIFLSQEALEHWSGTGYQRYSDGAIELCLLLRERFGLPLRQTEGFVQAVFQLAGFHVTVPDYTTLSRRALSLNIKLSNNNIPSGAILAVDSTGLSVYTPQTWNRIKHKQQYTSHFDVWRKLHICMDTVSGEILTATYSDARRHDGEFMADLLGFEAHQTVKAVCADMAYDTVNCRRAVVQLGAQQRIPPKRNARLSHHPNARNTAEMRGILRERDVAVRQLQATGGVASSAARRQWKQEIGYHRRSLVETAMWRIQCGSSTMLTNKTEENRRTQALLKCKLANILLAA